MNLVFAPSIVSLLRILDFVLVADGGGVAVSWIFLFLDRPFCPERGEGDVFCRRGSPTGRAADRELRQGFGKSRPELGMRAGDR